MAGRHKRARRRYHRHHHHYGRENPLSDTTKIVIAVGVTAAVVGVGYLLYKRSQSSPLIEGAVPQLGGGATQGQGGVQSAPPPNAPGAFSITSVVPTSGQTVDITFNAPPDPGQAVNPANYSIQPFGQPSGLKIASAQLKGNVVTLTTEPQASILYTLMVRSISRAADGAALATKAMTFTGKAAADLASAAALSVAFAPAAMISQGGLLDQSGNDTSKSIHAPRYVQQ